MEAPNSEAAQLPDIVSSIGPDIGAESAKKSAEFIETLIKILAQIIIKGGINAVNMFNTTLIACGTEDTGQSIKARDVYDEICSKGVLNLIGMSYKNTSIPFMAAVDFIKFIRSHVKLNESNAHLMPTTQRPPLVFLKATANAIALDICKSVWGVGEREINAPQLNDFNDNYTLADVNLYSSKLSILVNKLILIKIANIHPFGQDDVLTHISRKDDYILINNISSQTMYCMVATCYEFYTFAQTYKAAQVETPKAAEVTATTADATVFEDGLSALEKIPPLREATIVDIEPSPTLSISEITAFKKIQRTIDKTKRAPQNLR
jgi:hypothetical protein